MPFYILSLDGSSDRTYIRSPKISNSKSMGIIERALMRSRKRQFVNNRVMGLVELLLEEGYKYVLTGKFNQDCIEAPISQKMTLMPRPKTRGFFV
ncbi:hypothetical protein OUZ56_003087 [Daphnia magna]|uniref:Uncharacterized protein n=1 Tax=Daphnia magna TaxID=35525 RepID=A0ABR0A7R2_9CRUS|nr:hypothetical protein OUZ56_003087 [Daphnia magna]